MHLTVHCSPVHNRQAEEPAGQQSIGTQRVGHDLVTNHTHTHTVFSRVAVSNYIPTKNVRGFPFLYTLSSIYCL